jgi:hypothetical protein
VIDQVTLRTEPFVSRPVITFVNAAEARVLESGQTAGGYTAIVNVGGTWIEVRGAIVDGIVRVSTAFGVK